MAASGQIEPSRRSSVGLCAAIAGLVAAGGTDAHHRAHRIEQRSSASACAGALCPSNYIGWIRLDLLLLNAPFPPASLEERPSECSVG